MKYKLGLDVGTASVAVVAYQLDGSGQPVSVPYHSVRIFNEPLLPPAKGAGIGELKQAARRKTRQQMRLHQRRARRLRKLAYLAPLLGVDSEAVARRRKPHILEVRAQAATEKVALEDLLRIFLHLSKRRGYAGTFRARKGGDTGVVKKGIAGLRKAMDEAGFETLGEYLLHRHRQGQHLRLKNDGLYADREMIRSEFDRIWTAQEREHEQLCGGHEGRSLREIFHEAIFYQRPIRILSAGNCELETSLPRSPLVQPAFQEFRIEKQIADLRWAKKGRRHPKPLEEPAKQVIRNLLSESERMKFEEIYEALEKEGIPRAPDEYLNLSEGGREDLRGNGTNACMKELGLESEWQNLAKGHRVTALNLLADIGSPDVFYARDWHENIPKGKRRADGTHENRCIPGKVVNFINSMVKMEKLDWLSKMGFEAGRSAYSIKALRGLTAAMRDENLDEAGAIERLYPQAAKVSVREELLGELPPHEKTGNIVVDMSLRQVRREVNAAIRKLGGPPDSVAIELSREMPLGVKRRGEIIEQNNKNRRDRKNAKKEIKAHTGKTASESAITRYLLWGEQDKQWCPYCTSDINLGDVLDGSRTHYEHIFPRSITHMGKRRDYLVLAHRSCNDEKGARTPWEKWGNDPERWKVIKERARRFEARAKKLKKLADRFEKRRLLRKMQQILSKESGESLLDSEAIEKFSDRQLQDTAWISKSCAQWMEMICPDVAVSRGILTAFLRRKWGLETVIPEVRFEEKLPVFDRENQVITREDFELHRAFWEERGGTEDSGKTHRKIEKRIDHRHHLIDALAIGLTSRALYQKMARAYKRDAEKAVSPAARRKIPLRAKPPIRHIRKMALELVRDCKLTHKRDRWPAGPFFTEQPLSVVEIDGRHWFAQRKTLTEIAAGGSEATVRGQIERIVSQSTREAILKAFNQRIESGKSPEEALSEPILDPYYGQPIRRVKMRDTEKADGAILVEHHGKLQNKSFEKYMKTNGYAYLELDAQQGEARLVTLYEAMKSGRPEASKGVRFFKGDTVLDARDEKRYVVRQIKADGGGSLVLTLHTETRGARHMNSASGKKLVSAKNLSKLSLIPDAWPPHSAD